MNGWIFIDKEKEQSSFQVVKQLKSILNIKKIGHAGTLDPFATGVLAIALGEATKSLFYFNTSKTYLFNIFFGESKDTDDITGETIKRSEILPSKKQIDGCLKNFIGIHSQVPPRYSAIKINGQRAYELARKGVNVDIPERKIFVNNLDIIKTSESTLKINISCSKGTYIRSIAQDISKEFGYDGYLLSLRRESIGKISLNNALSFNDLETLSIEKIYSKLVSVDTLFIDTNKISLDKDECTKVCNGQEVFSSQFLPGQALIYSYNRDFIGIGEVSQEKVLFPKKIFV